MYITNKYIVTTSPILKKAMMNLLRSSGVDFVLSKEFSNGIYLLTCDSLKTEKQIKALQNSKQFVKHIFKVEKVLKGAKDLDTLILRVSV